VTEPPYVQKLIAELGNRLPGAQINSEHVRSDRFRVAIVSSDFEKLGHPERQQLVWDIADSTLAKHDLLKISMILTVAPSELMPE